LAITNSLLVSGVLLIVVTAAFTFAPSFLYYQIAEIAPKSLVNFCNSVMLIFVNISVFCTLYIYGGIAKLIGNATPEAAMMVAGVIGLILFVIISVVMKFFPVQKLIAKK